ncbi:MAG: hypothetical protein PHI47_06585 [Sulfuricurvum sp.]|uniref:hypothetical protein n=1 Tax=Sulfuricurvum sp. TaxID=2025608 RepID=UPI002608C38B|nr:hypothetical protein [Sulfuricurvum sp.]MDD5159701.1 hypothetical protein [Sulfuricurvum sp.]
MAGDEMEHRVRKLEDTHIKIATEWERLNDTLEKIEEALEKQNENSTEIRELKLLNKVRDERIKALESNQSKLGWVVILIVIAAVIKSVMKG